jgi:hypothetical protein
MPARHIRQTDRQTTSMQTNRQALSVHCITLTASQVDNKRSQQMFVVEQDSVHSRAGGVVDGEVTCLFVATEKICRLVLNNQFLK